MSGESEMDTPARDPSLRDDPPRPRDRAVGRGRSEERRRPGGRALWSSLLRRRDGIGFRLLASVLLFSSAVTLVLTALQLYLDYRHDVGVIEGRLGEIQQSYLGSLGESLWNLDQNQLELQLKGILRLPDIAAVEIRETDTDRNPLMMAVGHHAEGAAIIRDFPIIYPIQGADEKLGVLHVEATLAGVYRELLDKVLIILVSQGAKTFLVSLFILYIIHRLITRHLISMAEGLRGYDFRHPPQPLKLWRLPRAKADELDQVVAAFNAVCASLQRAYDELQDAKARLERDIAARKRAEDALRESEQRFRDYTETASDWYWETGPDHRFTRVSDRLATFHIDPAGRIGMRRSDFATDVEEEPEKWRQFEATLAAHQPFRGFTYRTARGDGSPVYIWTSGKPVFDGEGGFLGYRGVSSDVTERALAEARVRELSLAAEQSPAGIAIADAEAQIIYANEAFKQITELGDAAVRTPLSRIFSEATWHGLSIRARKGEMARAEVSAQRASAERFWADASIATARGRDGAVARFILTLEDITRRKMQEREREDMLMRLQQAAKMEAIGRLAGGIAHDFNNLLGAQLGFAQFLVEDLPADSQPHQFASRILQVCRRGRDLVDQLLAFARTHEIEQHVLDLSAAAASCRDLLRASLPSSTTVVVETTAEVLPVRGNEGQLHQLLLNLCLNANDALGGKPGTIAIRLDRIQAAPDAVESAGYMAAGHFEMGRSYARLAVSDTGAGMDTATMTRIFEPFFTTKDRGRGTGLGLAMVHGIVTASEGVLTVRSELGAGSTFGVYFPLEAAQPESEAASAAPESAVRGRERILVVDDEPDLADVLAIGLERLGYEVVGMTDPRDALETVRENPEAWDVVVTDQVMPRLKGLSLITALKALRPELTAVLYTGFDDETTDVTAREHGADALLHKPVEVHELARTIRQLRDTQTAPAQGSAA